MSDYVPFEIQVEIMKRLPVKSLLQFRSVSKQWKSLIDSSAFIAGYGVRESQPQRLLVWYRDPVDLQEKYVSFIDGEIFAQKKLAPTVDVQAKLLKHPRMVGSSQGLFCLFGSCSYNPAKEMTILWNPSIRKSIHIPLPDVLGLLSGHVNGVLGFGVCPITDDPKIVMIKLSFPPVVKVFTLSSGSWKILYSNLFDKDITFGQWSQVVVDKFIYWIAFDRIVPPHSNAVSLSNLIVSFDMTTHEFRVVHLPESLAPAYLGLSISKLQESLVVLEEKPVTFDQVCHVWMMDHCVSSSFTKLFSFNTQHWFPNTLGFTKSGEAFLEVHDPLGEPAALVVYEPSSKHIKNIGIKGKDGSFFVGSYMETLLLLDQLNFSVNSDIN